MRTSKELFQSSPDFTGWKAIIANTSFEAGCNAALLGFIESLPETSTDPSKSWDSHCQIVGARRVLDVLSKLHEADKVEKPLRTPSLNYDLKNTQPA